MLDVCIVDTETERTIGEHEWVEKECRVKLDSFTHAVRSILYVWQCRHCGRDTASDDTRRQVLCGPP